MTFIKILKSRELMKQKNLSAQAVIEYIIVFIVVTLVVAGFISRVHGTFDNHFQAMTNQILR